MLLHILLKCWRRINSTREQKFQENVITKKWHDKWRGKWHELLTFYFEIGTKTRRFLVARIG